MNVERMSQYEYCRYGMGMSTLRFTGTLLYGYNFTSSIQLPHRSWSLRCKWWLQWQRMNCKTPPLSVKQLAPPHHKSHGYTMGRTSARAQTRDSRQTSLALVEADWTSLGSEGGTAGPESVLQAAAWIFLTGNHYLLLPPAILPSLFWVSTSHVQLWHNNVLYFWGHS